MNPTSLNRIWLTVYTWGHDAPVLTAVAVLILIVLAFAGIKMVFRNGRTLHAAPVPQPSEAQAGARETEKQLASLNTEIKRLRR